jgi:hypothetical protein
MNATLYLRNPKKSFSEISLTLSTKLYKQINSSRIVVEFIGEIISIREALQMDENSLKVHIHNRTYRVSLNNKKGQNFLGKWNVRQEGECFILDRTIDEQDE